MNLSKQKNNFALIGLAGYIAPRHIEAIYKNKGLLVCALDPHESVGFIDNYFPQAKFFTQFERFDRYIDKISKTKNKIDFLSICSPNNFHDSHIRFGLKSNSNVICEKPLVISPWNLDKIEKIQKEYKKNVYSINQLRLHPSIIKLKNTIKKNNKVNDVEITYIAPRGNWYKYSWKGDIDKSGGVLYNIGIHFFDLITYIFGNIESTKVNFSNDNCYAGIIKAKKANIRYLLSIEKEHLAICSKKSNINSYKLLKVNNKKIDLSKNFENLHTLSYKKIIQNKGYTINDIRAGIELVYKTKFAKISSLKDDYHPLLKKIK